MYKILLLSTFPIAALITLTTSIFLFFALTNSQASKVKGAQTEANVELRTNSQLFSTLPTSDNTIAENIVLKDARVEIVKQFLTKYGSPLLPFAKKLVDEADKHNLDFRLLPAVAMQESGLCKIIPDNSYNCWGYGIYADKITRFSSYDEAIETVAQGLSSNYLYDGLSTPEQIMSRYTPSSNGSWAQGVRTFMEEME